MPDRGIDPVGSTPNQEVTTGGHGRPEDRMRNFRQIEEERTQLKKEVVDYMYARPEEPIHVLERRYGVPASTIRRWARETGLGPRKPGRKPLPLANWREL